MARIVKMSISRALILTSLCTGCAATDPMVAEPGRWTPNGANEANLIAQIADPGDLGRGRGVISADGQMAAAAVARLRKGHVKPLPDNDLSDVRVSGAPAPPTTPADSEGSQ